MADIAKMKTAIDGFGKQTAPQNNPPANAAGSLPTGPDGPILIQTQSPPPPPVVQKETNYVQVQVDSPELQGLRMAMNKLVQDNPGAQPIVESLNWFAKQYASGIKPAAA